MESLYSQQTSFNVMVEIGLVGIWFWTYVVIVTTFA
jgi:hypothetical protein